MTRTLTLGLLCLLACSQAPPADSIAQPVAQRFFAHQSEPCGLAALEIADSASGPFRLVVPTGPSRPAARLRAHVRADLMVTGSLTGRTIEDAECGALPELRVVALAPWGRVHRLFSRGALDGALQVYTEALPPDGFAPEDFEDGPEPLQLDGEACVAGTTCAPGRLRQTNADGALLCCPPLSPAPAR